MDAPWAVPVEDYNASNLQERLLWKRCLFLNCDPDGFPYYAKDFEEALKPFLPTKEIAGLGPMGRTLWLLKLKKEKAWTMLAGKGSMLVKQRYCAIVEPFVRETWMRIYSVPLSISNSYLAVHLENQFGKVKKVSSSIWSMPEEAANSTARFVRLCLREGLEEKDIPHLWSFQQYRFPILISRRPSPPMCFKCNIIGHMTDDCNEKSWKKSEWPCRSKCAASGEEGKSSANDADAKGNVPMEEPGNAQVAAQIAARNNDNTGHEETD
ncbi:hypothetical protein HPB50_004776 [Hyalomma asiaticum]|uniref:Uncharacterized protein n=1 Tax=Hyalomma asiaticum TaxID=266040 RepID=A0ACB7TCL7_HYAAI|nr:hypothetical protein HPB50_004776 [Hyalomma asiaticum]